MCVIGLEIVVSRSINNKLKIMSHYNKLQEMVAAMEADFHKFYEKGNKAAGTRIRKGMQDLKNMAQDIRKDVLDKRG